MPSSPLFHWLTTFERIRCHFNTLPHLTWCRNTEIIKIIPLNPWSRYIHRLLPLLTCLKVHAHQVNRPNWASLVTSLPLKMSRGIRTHLLSTEVNGKDWRVICTQNWTLAYALHAIWKCKLVFFIRRLMRPGCHSWARGHFTPWMHQHHICIVCTTWIPDWLTANFKY